MVRLNVGEEIVSLLPIQIKQSHEICAVLTGSEEFESIARRHSTRGLYISGRSHSNHSVSSSLLQDSCVVIGSDVPINEAHCSHGVNIFLSSSGRNIPFIVKARLNRFREHSEEVWIKVWRLVSCDLRPHVDLFRPPVGALILHWIFAVVIICQPSIAPRTAFIRCVTPVAVGVPKIYTRTAGGSACTAKICRLALIWIGF